MQRLQTLESEVNATRRATMKWETYSRLAQGEQDFYLDGGLLTLSTAINDSIKREVLARDDLKAARYIWDAGEKQRYRSYLKIYFPIIH